MPLLIVFRIMERMVTLYLLRSLTALAGFGKAAMLNQGPGKHVSKN